VEQSLWKTVYYRPIEEFRRRIKHAADAGERGLEPLRKARLSLWVPQLSVYHAAANGLCKSRCARCICQSCRCLSTAAVALSCGHTAGSCCTARLSVYLSVCLSNSQHTAGSCCTARLSVYLSVCLSNSQHTAGSCCTMLLPVCERTRPTRHPRELLIAPFKLPRFALPLSRCW
jgi:hypothetical protein